MKLSPAWDKDAAMVWSGAKPDSRCDVATFEVVKPGIVKDRSGTYKYDNWRSRWRTVDQQVDGPGEVERLPVGWHEHEKMRSDVDGGK